MTIMRKCEGCSQPIPQRQFIQLTMRALQSDEGDEQDNIEQVYGDYCDGCLASGKAIEDLAGSLTKYKGIEAIKKKEIE